MDWLGTWIGIVAMLTLIVIWTLVVRSVPEILTKGVLRRIDHEYAKKLEQFKSEIQTAHSSINRAVEIASSQTEFRSRSIRSTENFWKKIIEFDDNSHMAMLDSILYEEELDEQIRKGSNAVVSGILKEFSGSEFVIKYAERLKKSDLSNDRLFISIKLWDIYRAIVSVHGRFQFLLNRSIAEKRYLSWKHDELFQSNLKGVLDEEVIENARKRERGGLQTILIHLQTEFLAEASRVMSGSSQLESTVPSVQAVVERELSRLTQERDTHRRSDESPAAET